MAFGISLPIICAAKSPLLAHCFACLSAMMNHPLLLEEEKYLGLWLVIQSTNNPSSSCLYSYEQIAKALNKSCEKVHRILTRLRVMGFIIADLPIHYEKLTKEMMRTTYQLKLIKPVGVELVLPYHSNRKPLSLNLIKFY